ncbi:T9SS type A sorting domain-containing protein [bacterium]|nr:T9SS type A sorting domain-containing protein [bacterium]
MKVVKGWLIAAVLMVGIAGSAYALPEQAMKSTPDQEIWHSTTPTESSVDVPYAHHNELDEQVGDTLWVGTTWRDMQHNGTIGRMIAVHGEGDDQSVQVSWCYRASADGTSDSRYVKILFEEGAPYLDSDFNGSSVNTEGWSAYQELHVDPVNGAPYINYHAPGTGDYAYSSRIGSESPFVPGFFQAYDIPHYAGVEGLWPRMVTATHDGTLYFHTLINGYDTDDTKLFYHRAEWDPVNSLAVSSMPDGINQRLVTEVAMNLSGALAASDDGSLVTLGQTASRFLQGEGPSSWEDTRASQSNNDIYLWTSTDAGVTWDFDNPINMTDFIAPVELDPGDTTGSNMDTLRAYTNIDLQYDQDDVLHAAFNVLMLDYYRSTGASSRGGRCFYWNDQDQTFSEFADGLSWFTGYAPAWELIVDSPLIQKDDATGILWASWVQYGVETDTVEGGWAADANAAHYINAEIWVSASPDNGKRWTEGVNITNTSGTGGAIPSGEGEGEREMSMVSPDGDDYLHFFYTMDRDGGIQAPIADEGSGAATDNPQIYHRVPKQELIDMFVANEAWHRNYPLHVDSTDMYIDPNDWAWEGNPFVGGSVDDATNLRPEQFELNQNYPNPFNPSTQISFALNAPGNVKLAVYDVLGREVATLANRAMAAGSHSISFMADDLPSGVYFYKLTSGDVSKVRKMVLMK